MTTAVAPAARYELAPTHPAAIAAWAERDPDGIAVRYQAPEGATEWTRHDLAARCGRLAAALQAAGLARGDRVGIVGPSSAQWLVVAEGTQAAGGVTVGAYPTSAPAQLRHVFGHSRARFIAVADAALLERVLAVMDELPDVVAVVVWDDADLPDELPDRVQAMEAFLARAPLGDDEAVEHLRALTAALDPDDLCTIVYTSGTTGEPKGAQHSFRTIGQVADTVGPSMGYGPDDEYIVYLPLNHTAEQTYTIVLGAQVGWTLNFARSMATLPEDLCRVRPTVMFGVPRIFEKVRASLEDGPGGDDPLARFGLDRLRVAVCGGAPLAPELVGSFGERGVRLCNTYGMTEAGAITSAWDRPPRPDTCGPAFPGVELRLGDDAEILVRSPGLCLGYERDPEATAALFTHDGFLRTGDIGAFDGDELQVVDRKKDLIITAGGKNISPSLIEHALAAQAPVNQAVVVGNGRRYLVAVIDLATEAVRAALAERGVAVGPIEEAATQPEVVELVAAAVAEVNEGLSRPEQVKRFAILPRQLALGDPEITPTTKVKRAPFEARYRQLIDSLYDGPG